MARADSDLDRAVLRKWQDDQRAGELPDEAVAPRSDVTALIYFYRPEDQVERYFGYSAVALRETWRQCGLLPTVVVTNGMSKPIEVFAARHSNVKVQVEPALRPGDVTALSVDCNARLCERFSTEYVLVVQDDGFPLRPGLDSFVGKYDFVGAPYRQRNLLGVVSGLLKRSWPMNGGFCLRSRRFCQQVAHYWNHYYAGRPFEPEVHADDIFCTKTLPTRFPEFYASMRWPSSRIAAEFSYEAALPMNRTAAPFGFHGAAAFRELMEKR